MNEQELLAVLDMSEDVQEDWVCEFVCPVCDGDNVNPCPSLADLAFRLRDEVIAGELFRKMITVHEYCDKGVNKMYSPTMAGAKSWFIAQAKPIHWIIAALIAKEKEQ